MSDATEFYDKAVEAYNASISNPDNGEISLAKALSYVKKAIDVTPQPNSVYFSLMAETLYFLGDRKEADKAADAALRLNINDWDCRKIKFFLACDAHDKRADQYQNVSRGMDSGLGTALFMLGVGAAFVNWDRVINTARDLVMAFKNNFTLNDTATNAACGRYLVEGVGVTLVKVKKAECTKVAAEIFTAVREFISPTTSSDATVEDDLRDLEATADGYLRLLRK